MEGAGLHPRLVALLRSQGWTDLTEAQQVAAGPLAAGRHVLLVAPTGHGKTEAALLPVISRLLTERDTLVAAKRAWPTGFKVLYITPLRALNRDLLRRLKSWGEALRIEIGVRHGDTTPSERSRQARNPPDILITTPETLQLTLYGDTLRGHLATVRFAVLDEVHDMADSERGAQLLVALERIEEVVGQPKEMRATKAPERFCPTKPHARAGGGFQRIGLSATVADPQRVARWLAGRDPDGVDRAVDVLVVHALKEIRLAVAEPKAAPGHEELAAKLSLTPPIVAQMMEVRRIAKAHKRVLVFQNTRDAAELLASRSRMLDDEAGVPPLLGLHHGSLSSEHRQETEEAFKEGRLHALVATSSLELGIDIGAIDHVVQVASPRSVARLVQRLGRSGHHVGGISDGTLIATGPEDALECAAVARRAMEGRLEPLEIRDAPLVVLANQLVALTNEYADLQKEWCRAVMTRAGAFLDLEAGMFDAVWQCLLDVRTLYPADGEPGARAFFGDDAADSANTLNDRRHDAKPDARDPFDAADDEEKQENLPKGPKAKVAVAAGRNAAPKRSGVGGMAGGGGIGTVRGRPTRADFSPGRNIDVSRIARSGRARRHFLDHISLIPDEKTYRVLDESTKRSIGTVDDAFVAAAMAPGALVVMAGRSWRVLEVEVDAARVRVAPVPELGPIPQWSGSQLPVSFEVAQEVARLRRAIVEGDKKTLAAYPIAAQDLDRAAQPLRDHQKEGLEVATDQCVTLEMSRRLIVAGVALGTRGNEALGRITQALLSQRLGAPVAMEADAYRIHFTLPATQPAQSLVDIWKGLDPRSLDLLLSLCLRDSPLLRHHLVQVAKQFGALPKELDPNHTTRNRIDSLLDHLALEEETLSRLIHDRMDVLAVQKFLEQMAKGDIRFAIQAQGPMTHLGRDEMRRMMAPPKTDEALLTAVRKRIEDSDVLLACCACGNSWQSRVLLLPKRIKCRKCESIQVACLRPWNEDRIHLLRTKAELSAQEKAERQRLLRNGAIVASFGNVACRAMVGRGVGPDTAARILQKVTDVDNPAFWREILLAELTFARTNAFWRR